MTAPVIILVRPQLVENIGAVARAMMNCHLSSLRIVEPRDPWPLQSPQKERIIASASGADAVLENAKLFNATADAVSDLHVVYATTARSRDMVKEVLSPRAAMADMAARAAQGEKTGLLFGPERTGLINEDLICAQKIIHIPANPEFSSFNLAQSVLILAYEWLVTAHAAKDSQTPYHKTRPATREELFGFFNRLESELDQRGFFSTEDMKPAMVQNLRNALLRAELSEQEVRTWHGMLTALVAHPRKQDKERGHG